MLRTRLITALILIPIVALVIYLGNLPLFGLVTLVLTLAIIEFCRLMSRGGFRPAPAFAVALMWLLLADAQLPLLGDPLADWELLRPGLALLLLTSLAWQLTRREGTPVANWALGVAGGLYLGWTGAHLILLRALPNGLWWMLTVLPAVWVADTGAYFVGKAWGRHKLAASVSPGKSWEGYVGGLITAGLVTAALAALWSWGAELPIRLSAVHGLAVGLLIAAISPLGDLAISMMKRQVGVKDSSGLFPGHGGALDRTDSLLWAAVLGYYYVAWVARP